MSPKVIWRHAMNQMRTVWLMSAGRFSSPYEVQTRNPSLKYSFIAILLSYLLFSLYDYVAYPLDVFNGYVTGGVSRRIYVFAYFVSYVLSIVLNYLVLFLLANPLGYAKRFWHGLIAYNWWTVMVVLAILPAFLMINLLEGNDAFLSPLIALFMVVFILILWRTINLLRHSLKVSLGKAILLTVLGLVVQIATLFVVGNAVGIKII
ncbi:MAG: hypothetical protein WBC71_14045 [Salaquimonas sp.]